MVWTADCRSSSDRPCLLSSRLGRSRNLETGLISDLLPLLVLSAVSGARLYYVAFEWHNCSGANFLVSTESVLVENSNSQGLFDLGRWNCHPWRADRGNTDADFVLPLETPTLLGCARCSRPICRLGPSDRPLGKLLQFGGFRCAHRSPMEAFIPYQDRPNVYADSQFFHHFSLRINPGILFCFSFSYSCFVGE